jgi:type VI secretion system secreted protein VgrG
MRYTQDNRLIAIDTPLGKDVLLLGGFRGIEGLSTAFSFELGLLSENHTIAFEDIIGKNVTISVVLADGDKRYFNGVISRFAQGRGGGEAGGDPRFSHYRASMVPWLWLLTRTADSRIFQKLSVPAIVEKIFGEKGFSDFELQLDGGYEKREYCVQYRETDFNFVSRLLEEEGIYYFFKHENGKHTMVIADAPGKHKPCPKQETAKYQLSAKGRLKEDVIMSLEKMQEIRPGKYSVNDFNFETPNTSLEVNVPGKQKVGPGEREIYYYPGAYTKKSEGDRLAKIRMEEEEAQITRIGGSSNCRAFTSGYQFTLTDFYRDDMNNKKYVLTSIEHEANQDWQGESELDYRNQFTCIPFEVPFRPKRVTPKPPVQGSQTAIVVGPKGEEIYTDKHSRVKVQFHWDREGKRDENSSCWIRVSQPWAGSGWGALSIPRIGHEVVVDFIEGDPDRPIITGSVYHGNNKPPYPLPDEKTKSTLKSDSSLGGGGFNEMRFEDKKGSEEIFIHGQKDWNTVIENDKDQKITRNDTITVGNFFSITCGKSRMTMDKEGNVTITGLKFNFEAADHIQISSKDIDID